MGRIGRGSSNRSLQTTTGEHGWRGGNRLQPHTNCKKTTAPKSPPCQEDEKTTIEEKDEPSAATTKPLDETERGRSSRSLLSATSTVPAHLTTMYPIPEGCVISRTVHCDHALPHFQGRLPTGCIYEGKCLNSNINTF